jgi:hypothetical protein
MTRLERKIENAELCLGNAIMFKYGKRKFLEQAVKKLTEILMSDKYRDELDGIDKAGPPPDGWKPGNDAL